MVSLSMGTWGMGEEVRKASMEVVKWEKRAASQTEGAV